MCLGKKRKDKESIEGERKINEWQIRKMVE